MKGEVYPIRSSFLTGRLPPSAPTNTEIQLSIDGLPAPPVLLQNPGEFSLPLPAHLFDGSPHTIHVTRAGHPGYLSGCPLYFKSDYHGHLHMEPFAGALLTGWAADFARPGTVLPVDLLLNNRLIARFPAAIFRPDLIFGTEFTGNNGFSHRIAEDPELTHSSVIRATITGTEFELRGSPLLYLDASKHRNTLNHVNSAFRFLSEQALLTAKPNGPALQLNSDDRATFADLLLRGGNLAELLELGRSLRAAAQHAPASEYRHRFYTSLSEDYPISSPLPRAAESSRRIHLILYLEAPRPQATECIQRLLAQNDQPVTCIADGFVHPDFKHALTASPHLTLLENNPPLGFAASVNAAASLHPDHDLLLLDPETQVAGDWLERLFTASRSSPATGILTPFATSGELCCYPEIDTRTLENLSALSAAANAANTVDIPTVNGVCTYIRRACFQELGAFHAPPYRDRQTALLDFCLRAAARGWRTVLAAGILVHHNAATAEAPLEAPPSLNETHPYAANMIANFHLADPAREYRRNIDLQAVRLTSRPIFCFLSHGFGGGTERHIRDLSAHLSKAGIESLIIFAFEDAKASLAAPSLPGLQNFHYNLNTEFASLLRDLQLLPIVHFHIHSNIAIPGQVLTLPDLLNIPYDCTIHDYSWFCPRTDLIDASRSYCGEPPPALCDTCIRTSGPGIWKNFPYQYSSVESLRNQSQELLSKARKVFCPSHDTKARMERQFGLRNLEARGNPEISALSAPTPPSRSNPGGVGVAVIGLITLKKGLDVLLACAHAALKAKLPLRFVVVGFTEQDEAFQNLPNVVISGRYAEGDAEGLIAAHSLRLALFPSVWPETYSYTLSTALHSGLYPIAFNLGALAERIQALGYGRLLPLGASPETINAALLESAPLHRSGPILEAMPLYSDILRDYYQLPPATS